MKDAKRISKADRLMAIKRLPAFMIDYEEYLIVKSKNSELGYKKADEMGIKWGEPLASIEKADEIFYDVTKKGKDPSFCIKVVHSIERDPLSRFSLGDGSEVTDWFLSGDRLYLEVDIKNATKNELKKDFKRIIDGFDNYLKKESGKRNRQTIFDHWEVYDMHHKENMNFTQIARALSREKGNPTYNPDLEAALKAVKRAYNAAEAIMQNVEEKIKGRT